MQAKSFYRTPHYRVKEDHVRAGLVIFPAGTVVEAIQERIHYQKKTHRVQVQYEGTIAWMHKTNLTVTR